jgi:hypothetical protein
MFILSWVAWKS